MDSAQALRVATALEAALLAPILRPIAGGENDASAYFTGEFAQAIAARDRTGFAAALAAQLERR